MKPMKCSTGSQPVGAGWRAGATFALLSIATAAFSQVSNYKNIKTPPLRSFTVEQPKRVVLSNGMVIFLQEDHELPLIRGSALIRGGSRDVPALGALNRQR